MNIIHLKYAVEIAKCGSINKAAEMLYVGQPNLSRAIKELEGSLGVEIFDRSVKGMKPTPEGEVFLRYANAILKQVDEVENLFKGTAPNKKRFSISVPRASYIAKAFADFSVSVNRQSDAEIIYKETNALRAIKNITEEDYKLGIIRYAEHFDRYYKETLEEKGMNYELVAQFGYVLIMSSENPLAAKQEITFCDLEDYVEIAHADPFVPSVPLSEVKKEELPDNIRRRIFVFERASQFELLSSNSKTFMWVSPVPKDLLQRYGLVQRVCTENKKIYKDVMIYKKDYQLSELDSLFVSELCKCKRQVFGR